jgi:hypothetical protein
MKQLFRNKDILFLAVLSTVIILFLLIFISLHNWSALRDELNFNIPTAINFYQNSIPDAIQNEGYTSGSTPLPFILLKIITFGSYPNIYIYRFISFLISICSIVLLLILLNRGSPGKATFFITGLVLFQPYFLKSALSFYTASYGVLFLILFLLIYFNKERSKTNQLLLGIVSAAAVLCQQVYIALPITYTLIIAYEAFKTRKFDKPVDHLLFYLPHIFPLLLFIIWGGLTHDQPRNEIIFSSRSFSELITNLIPFGNITAIFTICGFYLLPASLYLARKVKWPYLIAFLIVSIFLAVYNQPVFTNFPEFNKVTGLVHRLICYASFYIHPALGEIIRVSSLLSFLIFIYLLIKESKSYYSNFLTLLILVLLILFGFDFLLSERHLIPLIVVLFVTLHRFKIVDIYYYGWFIIMLILGCSYTIHWFNI